MSIFPPILVETQVRDVSYFDATPRSGRDTDLLLLKYSGGRFIASFSIHGITFGLEA